jgi:hypothetical protein
MKRAVVVLLLLIANAVVSYSKHRAASGPPPLPDEVRLFAGPIEENTSEQEAMDADSSRASPL